MPRNSFYCKHCNSSLLVPFSVPFLVANISPFPVGWMQTEHASHCFYVLFFKTTENTCSLKYWGLLFAACLLKNFFFMAKLINISVLMDYFSKAFGTLSNNDCLRKQACRQRLLADTSYPWAFFCFPIVA